MAHFTCVDGAGSFIKPKMLTRGDTFGNVMRKRYVWHSKESAVFHKFWVVLFTLMWLKVITKSPVFFRYRLSYPLLFIVSFSLICLPLFLSLFIAERYLKMHEERVSDSSTRQLNTEVAHVKTWNGRVLPIELYGELQIRQNQLVEDLSAVTCRDDQICLGGDDAAVVAPKVHAIDLE